MKTRKLFALTALALVLTGAFTGCKKDNDDKKPACKMTTITPSAGASFNITYNTDGKIATMVNGTSVSTIEYSGNTSIVTVLNGGVFNTKRIVTMNDAGLATNVKSYYNEAGTTWDNIAYQYNGEEVNTSTITTSTGAVPQVDTYTWSNHNMVLGSGAGGNTSLDYYTDKNRQTGDYLSLSQMVQGVETFRSKNLIKSMLSGGTITSFSYAFGADGNISSTTATSGGTSTVFTFTYQCN